MLAIIIDGGHSVELWGTSLFRGYIVRGDQMDWRLSISKRWAEGGAYVKRSMDL